MGRDLKEVESALAHDLNNYLQVVMGNLELLRRRGQFVPEIVSAALNATRSAAQLADRLTALGRLHPYEPRAVDLGRLLTDLCTIMERAAGEGFRVTAEVAPDLAQAVIDPRLLHVVLLEIAGHVRDATPGGGPIRLRAANAADGRIRLELAIAPPEGMARDIVEACIQRLGGSMEASADRVTLHLPAAR